MRNDSLLDNMAVNGTTGFPKIEPLKPEIILFACTFALIALIGIAGNFLVVLAVGMDSKMRKSVMNVLLLNLAVADMCNLVVCAPDIAIQMIRAGWILPAFTCPLIRYLEIVSLYCSLLTQLAVCIERFLAIALPFKVHILCTMTKMKIWLAALWFIGLFCASPYFIYHHASATVQDNVLRCRFQPPRSRITFLYKSFECLTFYFVPLLIITFLYGRMVQILWWTSKPHAIGGPFKPKGKKKDKVCDRFLDTNESACNLTAENLQGRKNVIKMLIACVLVYFICYSPIQAIFVASFFDVKVETSFTINLTLHCLAYGCSAANPLLYSIFCKKFREKFHCLLNWRPKTSKESRGGANGITSGSVAEYGLLGNGRVVVRSSPMASQTGCQEYRPLNRNLNGANNSTVMTGPYGTIIKNNCKELRGSEKANSISSDGSRFSNKSDALLSSSHVRFQSINNHVFL